MREKVLVIVLTLLFVVGLSGNIVPQDTVNKVDTSAPNTLGQWYKVQMDTHTGYSGFMAVPSPASLYNVVKAWKDAGFSAVVVKDYFNSVPQSGILAYTETPGFDSSTGWYNYSVSGSPIESVAQFDSTYRSAGGGAGSGRLYVNGTGKAMVSYYNSTYSPQSGRRTLDLHRHQLLQQFFSYTDSFSGNVALGVEVRFASGRKFVVYRRSGVGDYENTSTTTYLKTLTDANSKQPFTHLDQWLRYLETDNPPFNITQTYISLWGQSNFLDDKIFDFLWFTESFDSNSWVDAYFDVFYWFAKSDWDAYMKDIRFAESSQDIFVIPSLEVTVGPPKNQMVAMNINASNIVYDGTISQFLTTSTQTANRGGMAFLEEIYQHPNGTSVIGSNVDLRDWLARGFSGFHGAPFDLIKWADPAWKTIWDEQRTETMWLVKGSDLHGMYAQLIPKRPYGLVYAEGTFTYAKLIEALQKGHFQIIYPAVFPNEVPTTDLRINDFSIGSSMMGDWATPASDPTLNLNVQCSNPISNVTIYWNGQVLKTWYPNSANFSQSLNVAVGGVIRMIAKDQNGKWVAYSQPIFLKPTSPYVKETTHPRDLTAGYSDGKLTLAVSAPTGTTSVTKVYVGDKGRPTSISGADYDPDRDYDNNTRILTLTVKHTYSQQVIAVHWIESTPPTTNISLSGVQGNNGWFTSTATVTFSSTDDVSGVDRTEYSLDNVSWTTYSTPFAVASEGRMIIYYRSSDRFGNIETTKVETVKIDGTAPTGSIVINNGYAYTNSTSATLSLTSQDAVSGVHGVRFSDDGVWDTEEWEASVQTKTWTLTSGDGVKELLYQIRDNAGLTSLTYVDTVTLDATKPTANAGENLTVTEDNTVTFDGSASTDNAGITSYQWNFGDGTTGKGRTTTHTYIDSGTYTVTLTVRDVAENSASHSITVTVRSTEAPKSLFEAFPICMIGAIILATGIVLTIMLFRKRRK